METTKKVTIAELNKASEEFSPIREELRSTISTLNPVELVTPKDVAKVKNDWIESAEKGIFENPQFSYNEELLKDTKGKTEELQDLQIKLLRLTRETPAKEFVWGLMYSALNDAIATTALAESMLAGDDVASKVAVAIKYGKTEEKNLRLAHEAAVSIQQRGSLKDPCEKIAFAEEDFDLLKSSKLRAGEIKRMFEWMMNEYNSNKKWPVEIIEDCSAIDVRDKSSFGHPIIAIPADREVSGWKLAELLGHEIECHWRNSVNSELIGALKGDDELVYEGLATTKDNRFNKLYLGDNKCPQPYYILAEELALQGQSFAEVSSQIYNMLPSKLKNKARSTWVYTYRTFRGITDTANPAGYAFTKDRAYFEGFIYANELRMRGLNHYLSFGTLSKDHLEKLITLTDLEDVEKSTIPDKKLQQKAIEKMLKCLRYGSQSTSLAEVKSQVPAVAVPQTIYA